ncbi:hypothetical protein ABMA28_009377 [Loxostege sticticalis]|uniref:DDE Tnp4 domain-containing protein n=1 Tax=Loxostege sticticalis TaxID=481309 RepID=A0ABD0SF94_LOXSC
MKQEGVKVTLRLNEGVLPHKFHCQNGNMPPRIVRMGAIKRKRLALIEEALSDPDCVSMTSLSSVISKDYVPSCSSESSWIPDDDSETEKHFKSIMRSGMLTAVEKEPKMLLGIPEKSYHLLKLLSENVSLPTIDILITLKKIKLNESFSILALHFGYSQSTISRIFSRSVPLIADKLKDLIVWPTPPEIYKKLPISFRSRYSNVVSIIDCFEIQIEKPSNATYQSLSWSHGRATDVMIVQDCGYLECLPPNQAVMADRGFKDLSCSLEAKRCTLIRPPSVSKSSPSTRDGQVKLSKQIAALRIHIERVISRLREFHMLLPHACLDHNLIPVIDDVIIIACGLINMQGMVIKK